MTDQTAGKKTTMQWAIILFPIFLTPLALAAAAQQLDDKTAIRAVMSFKTSDGSTIEQSLRHAEKMRPAGFKVGDIYATKGFTAQHRLVVIEHWIGLKRTDGDAFNFLRFEVSPSRQVSIPPNDQRGKHQLPLMQGRDALILLIDEQYRETCIDPKASGPLC